MTHPAVRGLAVMIVISAIVWILISLVLVSGPWGPLVALGAGHAGVLLILIVSHLDGSVA